MLRRTKKDVLKRECGGSLTRLHQRQTGSLAADAKARGRKVIEMLCQQQGPSRAQQPGYEAVDSRHI